ncbi:MAG: hypothetical protein E7301_05205 [Butyrivibrio sp.]|jgi:hypothetical protein|uniref:hypothetical protein n=1 Tax=Butyrivibrio sp. NC2002 TaxID=1410610 RepID=UPI00056289C3|nr:hypothetical protein [Butyrivibrio sp. NC2002]MBE5859506.1 hypothetical protein [Butyrivibrio sp.]
MNIYLCKGDETLSQALEKINQTDAEGRKFELDEEKDRCYIGDEVFATAPVLIMRQNRYYALREV